MSGPCALANRIASLLERQDTAYCEACLTGRLSVASRSAMRVALGEDIFSVRPGICPDCEMRRPIVAMRRREHLSRTDAAPHSSVA